MIAPLIRADLASTGSCKKSYHLKRKRKQQFWKAPRQKPRLFCRGAAEKSAYLPRCLAPKDKHCTATRCVQPLSPSGFTNILTAMSYG